MSTVVQTAQNYVISSQATTTVTVTLGKATQAGNCLLVITGTTYSTTNPAVSGVTLGGSAGNFGSLYSEGLSGGDSIVSFWADPDCAGGQTSVAVTVSGGSGSGLVAVSVLEVSGLASTLAGLLGQSAGTTDSSGTSWTSGATAATSQADELWVGGVCTYTLDEIITGPGSPWHNFAQQGGGTHPSAMAGYQVATATGTAEYAGTLNRGYAYTAAVITLQGAAAPVTGTGSIAAGAPGAAGAGSNGSGGAPDGGTGSVSAAAAGLSGTGTVEAPPALVSTTRAYTLTVTIPATTAGNTLVVAINSMNTAGQASVTGVKLGGSAAGFSQAAVAHAAGTLGGAAYYDVFLWVGRNIAGDQTTVTITGNSDLAVASGSGGVVVYEFAGIPSATLDQSSTGYDNTPTTTWSSGTTGTTTAPGEIWVGTAASNGQINSPAAPWTVTADTGGSPLWNTGYQIVSATGTAAYSGTMSFGDPYAAAVITLKAGETVTAAGGTAAGAPAATGSGTELFTGTGTLAAGAAALSGTGSSATPTAFTGTGSAPAGTPAAGGSGALGFTGTGSPAAGAPGVAAAGGQEFTAGGSLAASGPGIAGTSVLDFTAGGSLAASGPGFAGGAGALTFDATGTPAAAAAATAGSGSLGFTGSGTAPASAPGVAAAAGQDFATTASITSAAPGMTAAGTQEFTGPGTAAAGAAATSGQATGGNTTAAGSISAAAPGITGTDVLGFTAAGGVAAAAPSAAGTGLGGDTTTSGSITAAAPALAASGNLGAQGTGNLPASAPGVTGSAAEEFTGSGSAAAGAAGTSGDAAYSVVFDTPGTQQVTAPPGAASATARVFGGGGAGSATNDIANPGGGAGGGGEYAEDTVPVTPGTAYTVVVGAGGAAAPNTGGAGLPSSFTGDGGAAVTAHGGLGGSQATGGAGGTGSTNTVHFDGGAGGSYNYPSGGGGGSSAGYAAAGTPGSSGSSIAGGAGGYAPAGGGSGGTGGDLTAAFGGASPGGGGGGGSYSGYAAGDGNSGKVILTWNFPVSGAGRIAAAAAGAAGEASEVFTAAGSMAAGAAATGGQVGGGDTTGTGAPAAGAAATAGTVSLGFTGTGSMAAAPAAASGAGGTFTGLGGNGRLTAGSTSITASGQAGIGGTGTVAAGTASASGQGTVSNNREAAGAAAAGAPGVAASGAAETGGIAPVAITPASSLTVTIPATTAGDTLIVVVGSSNRAGRGQITGITLGGSAGGFAQAAAGHSASGGVWADSFIWAFPGIPAGQTQLVISGTNLDVSAGAGAVTVYEVTGLARSGVTDQSAGSGGTGPAWSAGPTGTTTVPAEFAVGAVVATGGYGTVPSGWSPTPGGGTLAAVQILTQTGIVEFGSSGPGGVWAAAVATFLGLPAATTAAGTLPAGPAAVAGHGRGGPGGYVTAGVPGVAAQGAVAAPVPIPDAEPAGAAFGAAFVTTYRAGQPATLYLDFYDEVSGQPADPSQVQMSVTYGSDPAFPVVAGPFYYGGSSVPTPGEIWRIGTGQYAVIWDLPPYTPAGVYTATWTCTYSGQQTEASENLQVAGGIAPAAPSGDVGFWTGSIAYTPPASNLAAPPPITLPLGGTDDQGVTWLAQKLTGWDSPPVQGAGVIPKSGDHGAWPSPQFYAARTMTLTLTAIAPTQALRDMARARLQQAIPVSDFAVLTWNEPVPKQVTVRRSGKVSEKYPDRLSVTFTVGLVAPDPRKYTVQSQTVSVTAQPPPQGAATVPVTVPFTMIAQVPGGTVTAANNGTFETRPVVTITGPVTSPALVNVTTGQKVSWSGLVLGSTDVLQVDFNTGQAWLNGTYRSADLFSSWWVLQPGITTTIQLYGSGSGGSSMQVTWQDAWI